MVTLEIEKPSEWSMGKKIGLIAIILLIIGPWLPYPHNYSYIQLTYFGLLRFIPFLSAVLIAFLLYFKFPIYYKKDVKYVRINHFILMIWGFWFFISYFNYALPYLTPGYGIWMIVAGYFMCILAGLFEWRHQAKIIPTVTPLDKVSKEPTGQQIIDSVSSIDQDKPLSKPRILEGEHKERLMVKPESTPIVPSVEPQAIEKVMREPTSDEEKILLRWTRHIDENNQTFEQCMKCGNYVFLSAKDTRDTIVFKCPDCGTSFSLKK
ncbi:MAG: hypothetical protein JSV09_05935 [Thermoplasmata archaeon]|nr:MAG: hypothetical protein JSV09_05935 [Thermoplasmata archaeon]